MHIMGVEDAAARADYAELRKLERALDVLGERMLERARRAQEKDPVARTRVLAEADRIARVAQASQGRLLMMLAQAHRIGAPPGGLGTWISTHLDVTGGTATGIMKQAKALGSVPELAGPLASGKVGPGTINALARTAEAVRHEDEPTRSRELAETLRIARTDGVDKAKRYVQVLKETLTPDRARQSLAKARERSFLRMAETDSGMCRIEGLLDPERATVFRATIDQTVSAFLRARQYDDTELVPEDVQTTEQLQAEALVRFAQNFAHTEPAARDGIRFSPQILYSAPPDPAESAGLAASVYGYMLPRTILSQPGDPAAHLLEYDEEGEPVLLDGAVIDQKFCGASGESGSAHGAGLAG